MKTIDEIFNDVDLIGQTPNLIMKVQLPDKIFDEVKGWIEPCRAIKDDEYAELLNHYNVGTGHNSYQTAIPVRYIDNSFFLGYVIHFSNLYLKTINYFPDSNNQTFPNTRVTTMRSVPGHIDYYDIWMNFTYKGDDNPLHNHAGNLSSIIYVKDEDCEPTIFPAINYTHYPKEGEMLLFPSYLHHFVNTKNTDSERITVSYNMVVNNQNGGGY
jgi:hypothetical protein